MTPPADQPTSTGLAPEAAAPEEEAAAPEEEAAFEEAATVEEAGEPATKRRWRVVAARVVTAAAAVLVLFTLLLPNQLSNLTLAAFVRIPVEGILAVVLVLVLPSRARRVGAALAGAIFGLLAIVKIVDMGFISVLARPFDPVLDWYLFRAALGFLTDAIGRAGALAVAAGAVLLVAAVLVLTALSMVRLTRPLVRYRSEAANVVAFVGAGWVALAVLGAQIVPGLPVAAHEYDRLQRAGTSLQDRQAFAREAAVDAFRDTPGDQLLTALRGNDVVIAFIESYGRDAVEDPEFEPDVGAVLQAGDRQLAAAGFDSRSAFLTSSTVGGASWFAHATLLSGLWVDNQQRYRTLVSSDRMTLNRAFQRAGWRTVAVMPAIWETWPEGRFYGYDEIYDADALAYPGPRMNWGIIPDQYTMSAFERFERADRDGTDRAPVMAEIALLSSHAGWVPVPPLIDWDTIGDGSGFSRVTPIGDPVEEVWTDLDRIRSAYGQAIGYSLSTMISYVETYGDDDLVFIFLGDHQPAPLVTGEDATADVPITIVAGDPAVLDRIAGWGWEEGLAPGPQAPVWPMDAFRDEFLTAFGPAAAAP